MARSATVTVKIRGIRELTSKFRRFGRDGEDAAKQLIQEVANEAMRRARGNIDGWGIYATGSLDRSLKVHRARKTRRGFSVEVGAYAEHAAYVEFGTRAKGAASSITGLAAQAFRDLGYSYSAGDGGPIPPGSIDQWLWLRGLGEELDFVIRRAIGRHGIEATPFFFPAVEVAASKLQRKAAIRYAQLARRV